LRTQIGKGKDISKPNTDSDLYVIDINLDLSYDTFYCKSNCGNLGLETGILLDVIQRIEK